MVTIGGKTPQEDAALEAFQKLSEDYRNKRARVYRDVFFRVSAMWACGALGVVLVTGWSPPLFGMLTLFFAFAILHGVVYIAEQSRQDRVIAEGKILFLNGLKMSVTEHEDSVWIWEEQEETQAFLEKRAVFKRWQIEHPAPSSQPHAVSLIEAGAWVSTWMSHMGAVGATVGDYSQNSGVLIEADHYIAQVSHGIESVSVAEINKLGDAASLDRESRLPVFFTSGIYAESAIEAAENADVTLFTFDVRCGTVTPVNSFAQTLSRDGFDMNWWPV